MNNLSIKISHANLAKIQKALKKNSSTLNEIRIGNQSLSKFLHNAISIESESPELNTKAIILEVAGDHTTDPHDLPLTINLQLNLHYEDDEYALLYIRLNNLVKEYKPTASLKKSEVNDCETVEDCVDLVKNNI
jgi:hypothetical protein